MRVASNSLHSERQKRRCWTPRRLVTWRPPFALPAPGCVRRIRAKKDHWAYRPLAQPAVPAVKDAALGPQPDRRLRPRQARSAGHEALARGRPADADPPRHFDLTGLPPTPEEVEGVRRRRVARRLREARRPPARLPALRRAVGAALDRRRPLRRDARPRPGPLRPNAWPYRDYLIRSFNDDKPYARFVEEQLAGDVLYPDDPQATVALGFLGGGAVGRELADGDPGRHGRQADRAEPRPRRHADDDDVDVRQHAPSTAPAATTTSSTRSARRSTTTSRRVRRRRPRRPAVRRRPEGPPARGRRC